MIALKVVVGVNQSAPLNGEPMQAATWTAT